MIQNSVFKTYDIRGEDAILTTELAYKIGMSFAKWLPEGGVLHLGIDGRVNSSSLLSAICSGISASMRNIRIIYLGLVPTPVLYFADVKNKPNASIMITGSHNPANHNGFKIVLDGNPFFDRQIMSLSQKVLSMDSCVYSGEYKCETHNHLIAQYIDEIVQSVSIKKSLKVAWDPGNGAVCTVLDSLLSKLPNENIVINNVVDHKFSGRGPDPTKPAALDKLLLTIKNHNCDFGVAFDGDGDRVVGISSSGKILSGDQLLAVFARQVVKQHHNPSIICDIKTSQALIDYIKELGGDPILCKTGHSWIKQKIKDTTAMFAGELSGHMFFNDKYYGYDDGIYAALRLAEILSEESLDQILDRLPKVYNRFETKIHLPNSQKFDMVKMMREYARSKNWILNDIDGMRVAINDGWLLVRASNTEDYIMAMCEGMNESSFLEAELKLKELLSLVHQDLQQ